MFVDRLFSQRLITQEEYSRLRNLPTSFDQSRFLLNDVLPSKSQEHYYAFIECLKRTEGQAHIAEMLAKSSSGSARRKTASTERRADEKPLDDHMSRTDRLEGVVTRVERIEVAKRIQRHWRHIGEALGPDPKFARHDLDGFEEMKNNRDRAQVMLDVWSERNYVKATRRMLILALREEEYGQLIRDVFMCDPDDVSPFPSEHINRAR